MRVLFSMSTDVSHPSLPTTAKTVIVPVNQGPIDTGIRVPVEQVAPDELARRQQASATQGSAAPASVETATLPSVVAVLQGMIVELREALAGQRQRVAELEQGMDALLRRLQRKPRDAWPAEQPGLFPEMQSPELTPPELASAAATTAVTDQATETAAPAQPKKKTNGHGQRRSKNC